MNKKFMTFVLILVVVMIAGGVASVWLWQSSKYKQESSKIDQEIFIAAQEIEKVEATKDENGYAPTDLVKYFMGEVKNGSSDKASLYLAASMQGTDVFKLIGISTELDKINIQEITQDVIDNEATVSLKGYWPDESKVFERKFVLSQEENAWKIKEIQEV